jgi:hypothetical protein
MCGAEGEKWSVILDEEGRKEPKRQFFFSPSSSCLPYRTAPIADSSVKGANARGLLFLGRQF